jgi:hypothetical protein
VPAAAAFVDNLGMDVVRFGLSQRIEPWNQREVPTVDISVNGEDLAAVIGRIERPFADAEGNPSLAGQYLGLELGADLRSTRSRHFLGGEGSNLLCEPTTHTTLMRCAECGDLWDWPLMARVALFERFVIWSDFVQPHRAGKWRYDVKFTFEREQYEDALHHLDDEITAAKAWRHIPTLPGQMHVKADRSEE